MKESTQLMIAQDLLAVADTAIQAAHSRLPNGIVKDSVYRLYDTLKKVRACITERQISFAIIQSHQSRSDKVVVVGERKTK